MIGYIRDPRTWNAVKTVTVTAYELPIETAQGETGKVTLLGQLDGDYSRYILSLENFEYMFKITGQQSGDRTQTVLTVSDNIGLLDGAIQTRALGVGSLHNTVQADDICGASALLGLVAFGTPSRVKNLSRYAVEFMHCEYDNAHGIAAALAARAIPLLPLIETQNLGGLDRVSVDCERLIRAIRSNGFSVSFTQIPITVTEQFITRHANCLMISFADIDRIPQNIVFSDGHGELLTESYNNDVCSCVTFWSKNTATNQYVARYLASDGTVSQNRDDQIQGYTVSHFLEDGETEDAAAAEIFAQNVHSHKIEFASDKECHIGQPVRLALPRGILDTTISKVMLKSGDNRYYYTCGELPVTASEHIKAGSWTYTQRLPANPRKGQLVMM